MKVSLGTLEIDEDVKRALGKRIKGSVRVNRNEVREWVLAQVQALLAGGEVILVGEDVPEVEAEPVVHEVTGEAVAAVE